ncbi:MAG: hypothetical protein ICV73_14950, partial [Acetobacteraceae bacterium]|nr:hypothetical protein [Acetobacteraceae bacterium]
MVILSVLLTLDALFLLAYPMRLLEKYFQIETFLQDDRFRLNDEGGYTERFEYLKTAICVCSLGGCWLL